MVDPVLVAIGGVAEGLAAELAMEVLERQRRRHRLRERDLSAGRVKRILDGAANRVVGALRDELDGLAEHEWQAAVLAARDSLQAVRPLAGDALASDLRPERLVAQVRERTDAIRREASLEPKAQSIYDRVLVLSCEEIIRSVVALPGFSTRLQVASFQDVRDVRRAVDQIAREQDRERGEADSDAAQVAAFEHRYLEHVGDTLGRLELFGVRRGRTPHTDSFDKAYVSVAVARSGRRPHGEDDDELTGAGVEVTSGLKEHRRVLLRGGAGAGKTTLLRWLAVDAAHDAGGSGGRWGRAVPFFVPLRQFAQRDFPGPEALPESIAHVIAAEMPPGWVSGLFREGRAMLLVDGLDELEPARRAEASQWLDHLVTAYGDVRFVVSARPFAVAEDWLATAGFVTFDLLPLSPKGIRDFVAAWHNAAREEHTEDAAMQQWLDECERGLADQFAARLELRRLAGSPLLCGLLCALYQDSNMHLPRDRKGLYDAALDLLLVRWDESRGVRVDELPTLTKEEQIVLLQRIAYSMVKNHEVVVARDEAARRVAHAMRGLRSHDAEPEPVLQRTLERTGLLREPNPDEVQFVHRTFRDYLAAKEVVDCGDLAFLVEQAHLDHWHDVVVNAVAHARPQERAYILRRLVEGNQAAGADPRVANRLQLVAAACLEQADVLDTDEIRELVQTAAGRLIPPVSLDEADLLARAGSFVLDLLPGPDGLSPDQAACVVRTAAMIGGPGVGDKLAEFVDVPASQVVDELLRAWRRSDDPETYARTVLADVEFGDRRLEVRGWHRVRCLKHFNRLTNVVCYGDFSPLDPVAAVPRLVRLELVQNELLRDLSPLAACRSLRTLLLTTGLQFLRDLSALGETTVEDLGLHLVHADLGTLRAGNLRRLTIRDPRIAAGLDLLPADLPLRELVVDNLPRSRNLAGIERWAGLEQVSMRGIPRPEEVDALASLPQLRQMVIHGPEADDQLAALEATPALQHVEIRVA